MSSDLKTTPPSPHGSPPTQTPHPVKILLSRGFAADAWRRFSRRPLAMMALSFVVALGIVAILSPAIAGTRPIV